MNTILMPIHDIVVVYSNIYYRNCCAYNTTDLS